MNLNKKNDTVKVAIIGAGPAGLFAASQLNFFKFSNCIIEENPFIGGQLTQLYPNKPVYDFPANYGILAKDIITNLYTQLSKYEVPNIYLSTKIESIIKNEDDKFIITTNNVIIESEYIVIATGIGAFLPNKLEVNNELIEFDNTHYTVDHNSEIYKNKRIVILGGGDSAVDWANYFADNSITNNIAIVHRRDEYRAQNTGIDRLKENNIQQFLNYEIVEATKEYLIIKHKDNEKTFKLNYDFLIVQYGQKINQCDIEFFNNLNKNEMNKFIVNQNQKTNIKNVFAIGSSTSYNAKANTIVTACGEATAVAWFIAKNKLEW